MLTVAGSSSGLDQPQERNGLRTFRNRTSPSRIVSPMGGEAERFRLRARQCRELAAVARDPQSRDTLAQMAIELDMEADKIDAEESDGPAHGGPNTGPEKRA